MVNSRILAATSGKAVKYVTLTPDINAEMTSYNCHDILYVCHFYAVMNYCDSVTNIDRKVESFN